MAINNEVVDVMEKGKRNNSGGMPSAIDWR